MPERSPRRRRKPHNSIGLRWVIPVLYGPVRWLDVENELRGPRQQAKGAILFNVVAFVGKKIVAVQIPAPRLIEDHDIPIRKGVAASSVDNRLRHPHRPHRIDRHRQLPRSGGRNANVQRIQLNVTAEREGEKHGQREDREQRNVNVHDAPSIVI